MGYNDFCRATFNATTSMVTIMSTYANGIFKNLNSNLKFIEDEMKEREDLLRKILKNGKSSHESINDDTIGNQ